MGMCWGWDGVGVDCGELIFCMVFPPVEPDLSWVGEKRTEDPQTSEYLNRKCWEDVGH